MKRKVYEHLAAYIVAHQNCAKSGNNDWKLSWAAIIEEIEANYLPSGSGFDSGMDLDFELSNSKRLVICFGYHHVDEHGYYDGWSEWKAVVTPAFIGGFDIKLTNTNKRRVSQMDREYFIEVLGEYLDRSFDSTDLINKWRP